MIPFADYLPDLPDFESAGATIAKNVYPTLASYRPLRQLGVYSDALTNRCQGAKSFRDYTGSVHHFAGDTGKLYKMSSSSWVDVSKTGGYNAPADGRWRFTQYGNFIIATNTYDPPQKYDLVGTGKFEDLGGNPPYFKYSAVVRDFLVTGYIGAEAYKIQWPSINDSESWVVGDNQADFQLFPDGGPVQGVVGGEYGLIFQEYAIKRMTYVGTPVLFQFDEIESNHGVFEANSLVNYGKFTFYLSHNGFYICDGQQSRAIGDQRVDKTFFADLDQNYSYNISAAIDPINKLVVWTYPGAGNVGGVPNKQIIYNWAIDKWSTMEQDIQFIYTTLTEGKTLEQLDLVSSTLNGLSYPLDSRVWIEGALTLSAFSTLNKMGYFDGPTLEAVVETGEIEVIKGGRGAITSIRPMVDESTATVTIGHRTRLADTVTYAGPYSMTSIGLCKPRVNNRYMRVKLTVPASTTWTHAQGIDNLVIEKAGRR